MSEATMTAADKFGIAFSIGFTIALIAIAMSFSTMSQSPAPVVSTPPPAPAPAPMEEEPMMEEETMEEEMVAEEEPVMEEEVEAAPMSAEVSIPSGSSLPGCEETSECYMPNVVTIGIGGTVTWTNDDTAAHTVTSGTLEGGGPDGIFDSSIVMTGKTFEHTFDEAGTYDYFCVVHPWMTGQVVVE